MRWDWRDLNVVTPVKNQGVRMGRNILFMPLFRHSCPNFVIIPYSGICGACYATSVVAMLETMRSIRNRKLSEGLSVQQVGSVR